MRIVSVACLVAFMALGCERKPPPSLASSDAGAPAAIATPAAPPRPTVPLARVGEGRTGSTIALARWSDRVVAFVADEDDAAVRAIDVDAGQELSATPLGSRPGQLLVAGDGRLIVALRDEAEVVSLRATDDLHAPLAVGEKVGTHAEPIALAETPDDSMLLVACAWSHTLEALRASSLERAWSVDVPREPRAVMTSSDGARAFLAHAIVTEVSYVDLRDETPKRRGIDLTTGFWNGGDDGPGEHFDPRPARGAFAIARLDTPKRERLFIPHVFVDSGPPQPVSGWGGGVAVGTETFDVDTIDPRKTPRLTTGSRVPNVMVEPARAGKGACTLPRAAALDARRQELLVACVGPDEVRAFDASKDDLGDSKVRRKWPVPGGPNGIAVDADGDRAVVWSAFDGAVSVLLLDGKTEPARIAVKRASPMPEKIAQGRKIFVAGGDPRVARDGRACASCHVDGREDGLVWASPKGPRRTFVLAGRVDHPPPFGWLGEDATLEEHIGKTLKNLAGTGLSSEEMAALIAWLKVMKGPPPSSDEADMREARGRALFQAAGTGCATCHVAAQGFTDHQVHDVRSAASGDRVASFATPSLHFIAGSGPYFHDGRYATLEDLLRDPKSSMGNSSQLSREDVDALAAYLRTL